MAGYNPDRDRKIIPRLRRFSDTIALGELDSLGHPRGRSARAEGLLASKVAAWQKHRTVGHATDLVGAALTLGKIDCDVTDAARGLVSGDWAVSSWARDLGHIALGLAPGPASLGALLPPENRLASSTLYSQVRTSKMLLRQEPNDPVTWVNLAFAYVSLGHGAQAERSMLAAVQLAADNRFVLRSAGRLWVHLGDAARAHQIVTRSERTIHDPWLLAAEIALGSIANRGTRNVKSARRLLAGGRFAPKQTSELASALATLELSSGGLKKANKLFGLSLQEPTENSIAQAVWAGRQSKRIRVARDYGAHANAFEAESWSSYLDGEWQNAAMNTLRWFSDEPFSRRPPGHGSYLTAVALEDYSSSLWYAETGLRANPDDFTLLNNLAFACLNLGRVAEARQALARIDRRVSLSRHQSIVLKATRGLLAFRTGHVDRGRLLYRAACDEAGQLKDRDGRKIHAFASVFYALEEMAVTGPEAQAAFGEAMVAAKGIADPIVKTLCERLRRGVKAHR